MCFTLECNLFKATVTGQKAKLAYHKHFKIVKIFYEEIRGKISDIENITNFNSKAVQKKNNYGINYNDIDIPLPSVVWDTLDFDLLDTVTAAEYKLLYIPADAVERTEKSGSLLHVNADAKNV